MSRNYKFHNPLVLGFVADANDCEYLSAGNIAEDNSMLEIDDIGFVG